MIYDWVMIDYPGKGKIRSFRYQRYMGFYRSRPYPQSCTHPILPEWPGIYLTNRQINKEMENLVHLNPIRLTIVDDLFFNSCADTTVLSRLVQKSPWIQENARDIRLQFTFTGVHLTDFNQLVEELDYYWTPRLRRPIYPSEKQAKISNIWRTLSFRNKVPPQTRNSLQAITEFLSTFPKLKIIELMCDHSDIYRTWTDFWGDFNALKSTGARCSFIIFKKESLQMLFRFVQHHGGQLMVSSDWRHGEHAFTAGDMSTQWWFETVFSESSWLRHVRLVSPDRSLSIPVELRPIRDYLD
jgi:hypothetical protein